ncbi:FixH family protein [Hansschlegelia zhihuaiae]|uniref:Nitrogen fixation protein FixH n=1 Tax=Hansschlegelia zhihuaiae TaxID=405005 RepID=A0A4Q0MJA6_9HYPH|nr:FixH family protein [Hansschlegelia zhihuaiae]RXF73169.1 nitrogen fixation protein FixH [Hansschlegelia zhihuaiae]
MTTIDAVRARGRAFTGRAFLCWLLGTFAVVLGVNFAMAYLAVKSFNGVEVKSSYAAGKAMPTVLREAADQRARGWTVDLHVDRSLDLTARAEAWAVFQDRDGSPQSGLAVEARLEHPSDEFLDRSTTLIEGAAGRYAGAFVALTPGGWTVELVARRGGDIVFTSRNALIIAP